MCAVVPPHPFPVTTARYQRALSIIKESRAYLALDEVAMIIGELGLADGILNGSDVNLSLDLTELQFVALAAALAAVIETKRSS